MQGKKVQQIINEILTEITEIAGYSLAFYKKAEEITLLGSTLEEEDEALSQTVSELFDSKMEELVVDGRSFFKQDLDEKGSFLLVLDAKSKDAGLVGRLAMKQLIRAAKEDKSALDKNSFFAELLQGTIPAGKIYQIAAKLKLTEQPRTMYLVELGADVKDAETIHIVEQLFADSKQDLIFQKEANRFVLLKAIENEEDTRKEMALTMVATMHAEVMVKCRIGYSNSITKLTDITKAYEEAATALKIADIFKGQQDVVAYNHLGIARLIHELPRNLCEIFLGEVFEKQLPDSFDEETQITIEKFFENNLNISETARQLYLHRNTLVYRLERLEKLLGLDIRKFEDAMTFKIAMMVLAHIRQGDE